MRSRSAVIAIVLFILVGLAAIALWLRAQPHQVGAFRAFRGSWPSGWPQELRIPTDASDTFDTNQQAYIEQMTMNPSDFMILLSRTSQPARIPEVKSFLESQFAQVRETPFPDSSGTSFFVESSKRKNAGASPGYSYAMLSIGDTKLISSPLADSAEQNGYRTCIIVILSKDPAPQF
jgi:hypothetical protein